MSDEAVRTFVASSSIVRQIWGSTDLTFFIFAGASAEFAVNKQVDWLYFTGRLPADPLGRLFSTVQYAQRIIFSDMNGACRAIGSINDIHHGVEARRGQHIPASAYKDVLYMLIHYSIAAFELVDRLLGDEEKEEIIRVFRDVGHRMHIDDIPDSYSRWREEYRLNLERHLENSAHTKDLFRQYRLHLGPVRYYFLRQIQGLLVPLQVAELLHLRRGRVASALVLIYKAVKKIKMHRLLISAFVPPRFRGDVKKMEHPMAQA